MNFALLWNAVDRDFAISFASVACDASRMEVVHSRAPAFRPRDDVVSFDQISWYRTVTIDAAAILAKPGGSNLRSRKPSSTRIKHHRLALSDCAAMADSRRRGSLTTSQTVSELWCRALR